ncbi:MAG: hypothetical protein JJ869_19930 [Marivita sp.]|uniref:hypothetical protein n=1 Tax=Marivita sp. TaxID=2003365 RepID=UPI001B0B680E|nr:hypothetical protein [Marivita sp.]MBO6885823.1 hypothetical protein [Marivita sp.]
MIEKAVGLAETRGWDFDIISPLQLALAIPSPRWRFYYTSDIYCSTDGAAWGFVMLKEFEVMSSREPEVSLAIQRLQQFCAPDEIDILPAPQYLIRYTRDIDVDINGKLKTQLSRAIDEAIAQIDMAWTVLMLVNWGDKSAGEALASANASELRGLSEK